MRRETQLVVATIELSGCLIHRVQVRGLHWNAFVGRQNNGAMFCHILNGLVVNHGRHAILNHELAVEFGQHSGRREALQVLPFQNLVLIEPGWRNPQVTVDDDVGNNLALAGISLDESKR